MLNVASNVKYSRKSRLVKQPAQPVITDHLLMTKEKLDYAVEASKRILHNATQGKLPDFV